ncbi:MAG: hypothetical protein JRI72_03125 [Deltaproteobacteria bacterium]|nr:hypothetical protein [Deltaproteobacteria bacterium]
MQHILIENERSYEFIKSEGLSSERQRWYTTSPWIQERLPKLGESVQSLEDWIDQKQINRLGLFTIELAGAIFKYLDRTFMEHAYPIKLSEILGKYVRKVLFPLLYKNALLNRWLETVNEQGDEGIIVGNTDSTDETGQLSLNRFATLYADLAKRHAIPKNVRIVNCPSPDSQRLVKEIRQLGQSWQERIFALLNMDREMIAFRFWKRILKSIPISLPFRTPKIEVLYYQNCELLEETFLPLLLSGCKIRKIEFSIPNTQKKGLEVDEWMREEDTVGIFEKAQEKYEKMIPEFKGARLGPVGRFYYPLLKKIVAHIVNGMQYIEENGNKIIRDNGSIDSIPRVVVTNAFSGLQMVLYSYLRDKGIPIYAFEHGITNGLSEFAEFRHGSNQMCLSHVGVCYNDLSKNYHDRSCKAVSKSIVVGAPKVTKELRFRKIQRILLRHFLGISRRQRVVVYIAYLYRNNYIFGPKVPSDTFYHRVKKKVVFDILGQLDDVCVLKLYPTYRYPDPDPFASLLELPRNVRILDFFEYRYLRGLGDVVICDSAESTLGWVWSTGVPLIFLDLPSNPLLPDVADEFDKAVFRIDCSKKKWEEAIRDLLQRPHGELLRAWKMKEPARKKFEQMGIFGPLGNAGRRAADFIVSESLNLI